MAMINGDTEQALGISAKANNEAKQIMDLLAAAGVTECGDLLALAAEEGKLDDSLRSMIKSFKVKYSMELQDLIERV